MINLILGDCLEKMKELPDNSIDAVITDPPYGLKFMGKKWDTSESPQHFQEFNQKWATECLRVLKTGGFMFAMGGTRTHHRLTCGIEDAGFQIRDELCWVYLQGFPKAQDLGMLIEKKLGGEGEDTGLHNPNERPNCTIENTLYESGTVGKEVKIKISTKPEAKAWQGWKTPALKPAFEPIIVAQKPCEGSITENVMKYGVGGFNIDECRIPCDRATDAVQDREMMHQEDGLEKGWGMKARGKVQVLDIEKDRYPPNLLMQEECFGKLSKFFLIPKASKGEKEEGCEELEEKPSDLNSGGIGRECSVEKRLEKHGQNTPTTKNHHPTVKPVRLMEHLIKLTTKAEATVLDPFMGSGTTGVACAMLNRNFIGIEIDEGYFKIAERRIGEWKGQERLSEEAKRV